LIAIAFATPAIEQRACGIELEDLRRSKAALAGPRRQRRALFVVLERFCPAITDPDVILGINGDAGYGTERPVFFDWKRLRPQRLDIESRRLSSPSLRGHILRQQRKPSACCDRQCECGRTELNETPSLHTPPPNVERGEYTFFSGRDGQEWRESREGREKSRQDKKLKTKRARSS
jgi:hypothetical protein